MFLTLRTRPFSLYPHTRKVLLELERNTLCRLQKPAQGTQRLSDSSSQSPLKGNLKHPQGVRRKGVRAF